jgi:hypothetical protein
VLELAFDCQADRASRSHRHWLGAEIISAADSVQAEADRALLPEEAGRDLEGLVPRSRDLREAMGSSVMDYEEDDI